MDKQRPIYAVIAKEYDSCGCTDELILLTHDKERAELLAKGFEAEWERRKDVDKWEYSFIVLKIDALDKQAVSNTYHLIPCGLQGGNDGSHT